ncbi:hypothetical protein T4A_2118 [Trichinella pseudospiralis]|uniref:Uncharacterized protein n=1 Tax=Trichinella pseudospiralis TaxID=6337 RepID=A0A0V1DAE0_TRIPS|nr:hypothetical protein T4A_2118 [Trichinella pseudospiralis]
MAGERHQTNSHYHGAASLSTLYVFNCVGENHTEKAEQHYASFS